MLSFYTGVRVENLFSKIVKSKYFCLYYYKYGGESTCLHYIQNGFQGHVNINVTSRDIG